MSKHHEYSPSKFPALDLCACYESNGETSEAAEEGIKQHKELECLIDGADPQSEGWNEGVLWAYNRIKELFKISTSEIKLSLLDDDFQEILYGTADVVGYLYNGNLAVGDYKSGQQRDSKAQLAVYALMAMQKHGEKFCQCFIWYGRDKWEESFAFTYEEAYNLVYAIIKKVGDPSKKPNLCEYCAWCKHSGTCGATTQAIATVASGYDDPIDISSIDTWHASEITDPNQLGKIYEVAQYLAKWADNAKHSIKQKLVQGETVTGYKLRNGAKKRHVSDIAKAHELSGLTPDEFLACCSVAVGKLEKKIAEKEGLKGNAIKETVNARLEEVIYVKENEPSIIKIKEKK